MGDRLYSVRYLSLCCPSETLRLVYLFENGGGKGGRPHGYLSLASVATGHSLVAPGGSGNGKEAGGVGQGGGEDFPITRTHWLWTARGGENGSPVGGLVLLGFVRGLSIRQHMCPCKQEREGGAHPQASPAATHLCVNSVTDTSSIRRRYEYFYRHTLMHAWHHHTLNWSSSTNWSIHVVWK